MIAIMISIKPYWFAKILNGEKSIEVRKNKALARAIQKLIDTQGYAPILGYCSKDKNNRLYYTGSQYVVLPRGALFDDEPLNGKVTAILICRKEEEIKLNLATRFFTKSMNEEKLLKQSCLTSKELENYLWSNICCGYAIHINEVKIFDKPKELSEFKHYEKPNCDSCQFQYSALCDYHREVECDDIPLTKAPQNFCYVEI